MSVKKDDIFLSKTLSWLLRHAAEKEGLKISSEGFIPVPDLLKNRHLNGKFTLNDIKRVVESNDKQRFSLRNNNDILEIKANQGHTLHSVEDLNLTPINNWEDIEVIHGTYLNCWSKIKTQGLSRMRRNHIHFAKGLPQNQSVISGMRSNAQVYIYINLELALKNGLKFYKSPNEVILSPGNDKGIIEPKFFLKVCTSRGQFL